MPSYNRQRHSQLPGAVRIDAPYASNDLAITREGNLGGAYRYRPNSSAGHPYPTEGKVGRYVDHGGYDDLSSVHSEQRPHDVNLR